MSRFALVCVQLWVELVFNGEVISWVYHFRFLATSGLWLREAPWIVYCSDDPLPAHTILIRAKESQLSATAKMKEHAESEGHIMACQTETAAASALREGSVLQQMHRLEKCERLKNRLAIKSLLRCTPFLARNHIAHTLTLGTSLILL